MNSIFAIIFATLLLVFLFAMLFIKKISIAVVVKTYFRNYYSNAFEESQRKFNVLLFVFFGLFPYALGLLMYFAFEKFLLSFNTDLLFQIDVVIMTIFCLFIAFDFNKTNKTMIKNELIATLLIGTLLIVLSLVLLMFGTSINATDQPDLQLIDLKRGLLSCFYALNFKIIVILFYSLKRMFILSK